MQIKTQFDIGQEVWLIHENKSTKTTVGAININVLSKDTINIIYHLGWEEDFEGEDFLIKSVSGKRLFSTKEELIKSL